MNNTQQKPVPGTPPVVNIKTSKSFLIEEENNTPDKHMLNCDIDIAGKHLIVDFWGSQSLQDIDLIESALTDAASIAGAVLLHIHLHQFTAGGGITGVALLAESHISIHTWPERDYAAFDVFMCGKAQPEKAVEHLIKTFNPERVQTREIIRGQE